MKTSQLFTLPETHIRYRIITNLTEDITTVNKRGTSWFKKTFVTLTTVCAPLRSRNCPGRPKAAEKKRKVGVGISWAPLGATSAAGRPTRWAGRRNSRTAGAWDGKFVHQVSGQIARHTPPSLRAGGRKRVRKCA